MDLLIILCVAAGVFYICHVALHKLLDKLDKHNDDVKLDLFPRDEK